MFSKNFLLLCIFVTILTPLCLYALYYEDTIISSFKFAIDGKDKNQHTITLTEDGFEPRETTIKLGDTVVFNTNRKEAFWPASSIHPEHKIYPEFDPKKPISPDSEWSFTFRRAGSFSFHDHIFANYTGKIIVTDGSTAAMQETNLDINACSKLPLSEKQQCWDNMLQEVLKTKGLDAAFDYFVKLYKTEPEIPKECHGWGHILGKAGYQIYKEGKGLPLQPETAYCGYGYFHGFIGELIKDTGDVTQTRAFCDYVVAELKNQLDSIANNCVHGVGHGVASMLIEEPENSGNLDIITKKGLSICEQIFEKKEDLSNCYDGVFNESSLEVFNSNYGLVFKTYVPEGNPFWYCQKQEERYKASCYFEFSGMFGHIFNNDVAAGTAYALKNITNLHTQGEKVIARIAADRIQESIVNTTHEDSIKACAEVPDYLADACFGGILNGFIQHGEPGNLHEKGYSFCDEASLSISQTDRCYAGLTSALISIYSKEQMKAACEYIKPKRDIPECAQYLQ